MLKALAIIIALTGLFPSSVRAQQATGARPQDQPQNVVARCVLQVQKTPSEPPYPSETNKGFDAYYNEADGTVNNNAFNVGRQMALYLFRKCMAQQGMPLK